MTKARHRAIAFWALLLPMTLLAGAASGQGKRTGCDVAVYWDPGYAGESWRTTDDQPAAGPHWDKRISSLIVISGIWDFYMDEKYRGEAITLPPAPYPYVGDHWNDKIRSFRCVRPMP